MRKHTTPAVQPTMTATKRSPQWSVMDYLLGKFKPVHPPTQPPGDPQWAPALAPPAALSTYCGSCGIGLMEPMESTLVWVHCGRVDE